MPTTPSQNSLVDRLRPRRYLRCGWYPPPAHSPPTLSMGHHRFPSRPASVRVFPRGPPPVYCFFSACVMVVPTASPPVTHGLDAVERGVGVNRGGWWTSGGENACRSLPKRPPPSCWGTQAARCHGRPPHRPSPHTPIHAPHRRGRPVLSPPNYSTARLIVLEPRPTQPVAVFVFSFSPLSLSCPLPPRLFRVVLPTHGQRTGYSSGPKGVCCSPIRVRSQAAPPVPCLSRARWLTAPGYTPPPPALARPCALAARVSLLAGGVDDLAHPPPWRTGTSPPPRPPQHPSVMISRRVSLIPASGPRRVGSLAPHDVTANNRRAPPPGVGPTAGCQRHTSRSRPSTGSIAL